MNTTQMDLSGYTKVSIDGIETKISTGSANTFSITLFNNLMDYLVVQVSGDTLQMTFKQPVCNPQAKATVTVPSQLAGLTTNYGSKVTIDGLSGSLNAQGGSPVSVTTFAGTSITASGGSNVRVEGGNAAEVTVTSSGGSQVKLGNLAVTQAAFSASGGASVDGMVTDTLTLQASGGSTIASTVKKSASGSCSGGGSVTILGGADTTGVSTSGGCTLSTPWHALSLPEVTV